MLFWIQNIEMLNGREFSFNPGANRVVYSDASAVGGAAILSDPVSCREVVTHCNWDDDERVQSSTYREMAAVLDGLHKFETFLADKVLEGFNGA